MSSRQDLSGNELLQLPTACELDALKPMTPQEYLAECGEAANWSSEEASIADHHKNNDEDKYGNDDSNARIGSYHRD